MEITYRLKLGQDEFTLKLDAQGEKEIFEKLSFFANLPKKGPNGEDDLKITHRNIEGNDYYALVSETAKQEFRFGQMKVGGKLFPKGWHASFQKPEGHDGGVIVGQTQQAVVTTPAVASKPVVTSKSTVVVGTQPQTAAAAPVEAPTVSPQVAQTASDVLAKFGIGKKA